MRTFAACQLQPGGPCLVPVHALPLCKQAAELLRRAASSTCPPKSLCPPFTNRAVIQLCNGRRACDFEVTTAVLGDPCMGYAKTLRVQHQCLAPPPPPPPPTQFPNRDDPDSDLRYTPYQVGQ